MEALFRDLLSLRGVLIWGFAVARLVKESTARKIEEWLRDRGSEDDMRRAGSTRQTWVIVQCDSDTPLAAVDNIKEQSFPGTVLETSERHTYPDSGDLLGEMFGVPVLLTVLSGDDTQDGPYWVTPKPGKLYLCRLHGTVKVDNAGSLIGRPRAVGVALSDLESPLTTKGDIWVRNATTDTRLPVGPNGTVLSANSAQATGLEWITAATGTVGGSGAAPYLPVWTGGTTLGNSPVYVQLSTVEVNSGLGTAGFLRVDTTAQIGYDYLPDSISNFDNPPALNTDILRVYDGWRSEGPFYIPTFGNADTAICVYSAASYVDDTSRQILIYGGRHITGSRPYPGRVSVGGSVLADELHGKHYTSLDVAGVTATLGPGAASVEGIITNGGSGTFVGTASANTFTASQTISSGASVPALNLQQTSSDASDTLRIRNAAGTTTATITGAGNVTATSFTGSGSGLTGLNASELGSGTIPDARFGTMDFGSI